MLRDSRVVYPIKKSQPRRSFPQRTLLILGVFGAAAILLGGLWYAANLPYLAVAKIEISSNRLIPASDIEKEARESIAGAFWLVLPKNNFFLISGRRVAEHIRQKFPQVSEIGVDKKFPNKLIVTVRERVLWGVYCRRSSPSRPPQPCFYLDTHGAAYETLDEFEGWLLPVIYSPAPAGLGKEAVSPAMLKFYGEAETALRSIGGHILFMNISTTTPDDVRLGLAENWELWVTASRPVGEWLEILKTVLEKDIGSRRNELEYIDLRFGNKVFYKYR